MKAPKQAAKRSSKFFKKNIVVNYERYVVGNLVEKNMIGEDDVFTEDYYRTSVKCVSQTARLYEIKKEDFLSLRTNKVFSSLQQEIKRKRDGYQKAIRAQKWASSHMNANSISGPIAPSKKQPEKQIPMDANRVMDAKGNLTGSLPHIGYMNKLKRERESQFSIRTVNHPPNPLDS